MFSHITLGTNDRSRSAAFYDAVLPVLGFASAETADGCLAYACPGSGAFRLSVAPPEDGRPATWGNGFHIAFHAADEAAVRRFHAAALSAGGFDEGAPGLRVHYAADYYGAYVRDPDGNKLQAVHYRNGRREGPLGDVVSHVTLGCNDLARAEAFHQAVLAQLGLCRLPAEESPEEDRAFGAAGFSLPVLFPQKPYNGLPATWSHGSHIGLLAGDRAAVEAVHREGLRLGAPEVCPPAERRHAGRDGFSAGICDPDGNVLMAVSLG